MPWPCRGHTRLRDSFLHSKSQHARFTPLHAHTPSQRAAISYSWGSSIRRRLYDNLSSQREAGSGLWVGVSLEKNPVEEPEILSCLSFRLTKEHVIEWNQHRLAVALFLSPGDDRNACSTVLHLWLCLNPNKSSIPSPESPLTTIAAPHSHTRTL